MHRSTASVLYERPIDAHRAWSQAIVFGQNSDSTGLRSNAYLYESDYRSGASVCFARFERVQKSGEELALASADADVLYPVTTFTVGAVRNLQHRAGAAVPGVGFDLSYGLKPQGLTPYYGGGNPFAFEIFLRVRPARLSGQEPLE